MNGKPAYSVHLDAIRGIAALVVFATHGRNMFFGNLNVDESASSVTREHSPRSESPNSDVPAALGIGHHAVIVFFVLSGYLVGSSVLRWMREGRWSWRKYLTQRLTRLWVVLIPALLIGLCLDSIGVRLFGPGSLYGGPAGQSVIWYRVAERLGSATFVENVVFLQTIAGPVLGTNAALWSLANEFWYYIAFPLLVILLRRGSAGLSRLLCLAAGAVLFRLVGFSIGIYFSIWLLGAAVSYVPRMPKRFSRVTGVLSAALFVLTSAYVRHHPFRSQYWSDLTLALIFFVALYACLHEEQEMRSGVFSRFASTISNASYTLYLVHLPALVLCNAALLGFWHRWPKDPAHFLAFGAVSAVVLAYAYLIYLLFERNTDRVRLLLEGFDRRQING